MIHGVLLFLSGIVLFLFAMAELSSTVQEHLTNFRIREYFRLSVRNPVYGILTGLITTILFQSSSATSVVTVGMVSAGLITFYHSLGILLGADIGTTLTVQLVVWKFTDVSPLLLIAGSLLWIGGRGRTAMGGKALFFFGLLFFGLGLVSQAAAPLRGDPTVLEFFQRASHPLFGILLGLGFAALIHSSAVPIALLVILAQHGLISLETALPVVFGANIGTTSTALFAALVANVEGRRSAVSHLLFKVGGTAACLLFLSPLTILLEALSSGIAQQIALGHLLFNGVVVLLFLPFIGPFSRFMEKVLPGKGDHIPLWPIYLDERLFTEPPRALEAAGKELARELDLAKKMYGKSIGLLNRYEEKERRNVTYIEMVVDNIRGALGRYLCGVARQPLSPERSKRLFIYSALVDDFERIADHSMNLAELAETKHQGNVRFTDFADNDLRRIISLVTENLKDARALLEKRDEMKIKAIYDREEAVDALVREARDSHLARFYKGICMAEAGPIFVEILLNLERISDHCENTADYIWEFKED